MPPNAIWYPDFKIHFPVGEARCHPLTIMDGFIALSGVAAALSAPVQDVFAAAFREFGLPQASEPHHADVSGPVYPHSNEG